MGQKGQSSHSCGIGSTAKEGGQLPQKAHSPMGSSQTGGEEEEFSIFDF